MPRKSKAEPDGYNKAFPRALRQLLIDSHTTKKGLADYLEKSGQAITYYCDGTSSPDWETIVKIAKYFSVSADYLLGLTDEITPDQTIQSVCQYTGLSSATVEYLHHCPDTFARNFYRRFFDDLVQNVDFHLVDVPKLILDAAQANVIAIRAGISGSAKRDIKNKVAALSDGLSSYEISADAAEQFFLRQAQDEIQRAIKFTIDSLQCEAIRAIKDGASIQDGDFRWIVADESKPE